MIKGLNWLSTLKSNQVNREKSKGHCVACLAADAIHGLCRFCRADLPVNRWHCRCCALPLAYTGANRLCGDCLTSPPPFDLSFIPWRYQYPVSSMISRYKYSGQRTFARPLIAGLSLHLATILDERSTARPDVLIPSPMLARRRQTRGFNQARDIAESLGAALSIPVDAGLVYRTQHVKAQRSLGREARLTNLKEVFRVRGSIPASVALVDDVVTTGATVRALAFTLRAAGAQHIQVWALARTPG